MWVARAKLAPRHRSESVDAVQALLIYGYATLQSQFALALYEQNGACRPRFYPDLGENLLGRDLRAPR
jgi:hypothetical protein